MSLRVGTRGSALALAQARWVAARLDAEIVEITTAGDLARAVGDKSRWTGALESALLAGEIDLAVHSAKDVPGELAPGTEIAAVPPREDPRDVLVGARSLESLPAGARVGTSALRRRAQLLAVRPDLEVVELRGNVDTRLRKLAAGEADALVLAAAGLARLGHHDLVAAPVGGAERAGGALMAAPLVGDVFVPAPGQGALLVQARAGDRAVADALNASSLGACALDPGAAAAALGAAAHDRSAIDDPAAHAALLAEREVAARLGASCHTAIGVHAGGGVLRAFAGLPNGSEWLIDEAVDPGLLAERLLAAGAADLLARAEAMSV